MNLTCWLSKPLRDAMAYQRRPEDWLLGALRPRKERRAVLQSLSDLEQLAVAADAELTIGGSS